jgi:hypothetical protein
MRRLTLALLLVTACDDRSYLVGTLPMPDAASEVTATGGASGMAATGGASPGMPTTGGTAGTNVPGVPACSIPEGVNVDRPVTLSPRVLAERLARFLWAAAPGEDLVLLAAAAQTSDQVRSLAALMTRDARFEAGVDALARDWLGFEVASSAVPAEEVRAQVDPELRASMVAETRAFVRDLFVSGDARLSTLLTASYSFVDGRLARLYDLPAVMGPDSARVELGMNRAGILTQASMLFSNPWSAARGNWVTSKLLCMGVPPPPVSHRDPAPGLPGDTGRQAQEHETTNPGCGTCHKLIDPVGFAFEHYDALGRWRDQDNGKPIDATGSLGDPPLKFDGARQLAQALVDSCAVQRCAVQTFLNWATGIPQSGWAADRDALMRAFVASGLDLRALFTHVAASSAFLAP